MPGANCSIYGCSTSRKSSLSIFKVPRGDDDWSKNWREKLVGIVTRDRVKDESLKRQIENKEIFICERHYHEDQMLRNERKTTLKPGSIPSLNFPIKSVQTSSTIVRPRKSAGSIAAKKLLAPAKIQNSSSTPCYTSFSNFIQRIANLKLPVQWCIGNHENYISVSKSSQVYAVPHFEIYIINDLNYIIRVLTWSLNNEHELYLRNNKSMKNVTLLQLISQVESFQICNGIDITCKFNNILHCIPKLFNPITSASSQLTQDIFNRSTECNMLVNKANDQSCSSCKTVELRSKKNENLKIKRKIETANVAIKANAPISLTSPDRLKFTLNTYKIENKELKAQIQKLQVAISNQSLTVSEGLSKDFVEVVSKTDKNKLSPFMRLFWEEQQKYVVSGRVNKYHPMLIRLCLTLASKSSSLYEDLRYNEKTGAGFLMLPSLRRLRDYRNYIKPQQGFNSNIIKELCEKIKDFSDIEKYIIILFDEMKIQENLVWNKHTGELIGYVNLGDDILNAATLPQEEELATHVLVFLLRSIVNPFKFSFANFATKGAKAPQLFPVFWKAVAILELKCKLKVVGVTCDGASPNRKFFRMHFGMTQEEDHNITTDVVYRTLNLHSMGEKRFIYFIADAPHLIKTARNSLANSGSGLCSRYMWNNDNYLLWSHISSFYFHELESGLSSLPKLTLNHVKLTSFSIMNVKLAAQVLSSSVSKALKLYKPEAIETAKFCELMDSFFDIVNIKSPKQENRDRKPFLLPFTSVDDERFHWLKHCFLAYFEEWLQNIENRPGNLTQKERSKMFIAWQTHEGLKITVHSVIELVQYLLLNNVPYVLTERFCQDPLENYFGRQRSMGARKDNPSLRDVGYNDNTIRNQKIFRPIAGNSRQLDPYAEISNEPVPCRKRPKKK